MRPLLILAVRAMALAGAAALCALVSNALAKPERHLAWTSVPPPTAQAVPVPSELPQVAPVEVTRSPMPAPAAPMARKAAPPPPPVPSAEFAPLPGQPIREIDSARALAAFRAQVPFLDARRSADYALGHVKGAWSLPIWEGVLEERIIEFEAAAAPPPEGPLVLYCSGGSCEDSHLLASRLFRLGYRNLLIYRDGYPDWTAQGRPLSTGASR